MAELSEIDAIMRSVSGHVRDVGSEFVRAVALSVHTECVLATPVDTGLARSNWQASLEAPSTSSLARPYAPGYKLGRNERGNAIAAIEQARRALFSSTGEADRAFVVNTVDYIGDLNGGYSPQAPRGFVDVAIVRGIVRGVQDAARRLAVL